MNTQKAYEVTRTTAGIMKSTVFLCRELAEKYAAQHNGTLRERTMNLETGKLIPLVTAGEMAAELAIR